MKQYVLLVLNAAGTTRLGKLLEVLLKLHKKFSVSLSVQI